MIRFMIGLFAIGLFAILAAPVSAEPDRISVLLGSHHAGGIGFDGRNPGLFLTWEDRGPGLDLTVGVYRNSYGRASVAATVALPLVHWQDGALSMFAGAALYPQNGRTFRMHFGDVIPIGGIQIRHGPLFTQILPSDGRYVDAIIAVGLTFALH